jgi:hypothetical protein
MENEQNFPKFYTVECIKNIKIIKRKKYYLLKWKDYPSKFNSWEPEENLIGLEELIEEFKNNKKLKISNNRKNKFMRTNKKQKYEKNSNSTRNNISKNKICNKTNNCDLILKENSIGTTNGNMSKQSSEDSEL